MRGAILVNALKMKKLFYLRLFLLSDYDNVQLFIFNFDFGTDFAVSYIIAVAMKAGDT